MKIEIISVSALGEGAEMVVTVSIGDGADKKERRKLLLFTEQYLELGIRKGSLIDEEMFDRLEKLSEECRAIRKGSDLLSYSSSSRARLVQRLRSKGFDKENAQNAAERLEKIGLIDERADVERHVDACLKKLWGKRRILHELCSKGYERSIVEAKIAEIDENDLVENCVALLKKKHKTIPEDPDVLKKIVASLVRYGYTFSEIKAAFKIVKE